MNTVDSLREARDGNTVPLALFYSEYKNDENTCYGFVEGKDDPSYYRNIIQHKIGPKYSIILYPAGGKKKVKYIYDKLHENARSISKVVYFMDRDLSDLVDDDNIIKDETVYITDQYSIENDFLNENTLEYAAQDLLGFSKMTKNEKAQIKNLYKKQFELFKDAMIPIMTHIIIWKRRSIKNATYNNLKIEKLFEVKDGNLINKKSTEENIKVLYTQSKVVCFEIENNERENILREIQSKNISCNIIRGKFLAEFFVMFCNSLYEDYKKIGINKTNNGRRLSIRDIMETIAPRARSPESLDHFIDSVILPYFMTV